MLSTCNQKRNKIWFLHRVFCLFVYVFVSSGCGQQSILDVQVILSSLDLGKVNPLLPKNFFFSISVPASQWACFLFTSITEWCLFSKVLALSIFFWVYAFTFKSHISECSETECSPQHDYHISEERCFILLNLTFLKKFLPVYCIKCLWR